ncbi:MAG: NTP transferase domain-containing protein [Clostridiales bacterium]|nr:NTP transferase domain-containing protein [Clostridiales bacterium]
MEKTALVILAAGLGTRYGGGIKQLAPVGPSGEIIIEYAIHDALEAGFNKVVFIIRRDLEKDFKDIIGNRVEQLCEVEYVIQELSDLPEGYSLPEGRTKPWGTGQAVLACRGVIKEPFAVINADDYYGREAFVKIHGFLVEHAHDEHNYCMAGFILKNTLSENGGVTRGLCTVDAEGHLTDVVETRGIVKCRKGAMVQGDGRILRMDTHVSMNMWGLTPEFIDDLAAGFPNFLDRAGKTDLKAEYLLPTIIGNMVKLGRATVELLETNDKWFGVTYAEDRQTVAEAFAGMVASGIYGSPLY